MGDYINKQSDYLSKDFIGHNNLDLPNNGIGTTNYPDFYPYYGNTHDARFSYTLNSPNGQRNLNTNCGDEQLQSNNFNDSIEFYSSLNANATQFTTNSANLEFNNRQNRYNLSQVPYVLTLLPQNGINSTTQLSKVQSQISPGFYSQIPINEPPPTSVCFHNAQRGQYFRTIQPNRNMEYTWYKSKTTPTVKGHFSTAIYPTENTAAAASAAAAGGRNFGPVGGELAGLRCGLTLRNFPTQVNMIRIFPDNRMWNTNCDRNCNYLLQQKQSDTINSNLIKSEEENYINNVKSFPIVRQEKEDKRSKSVLVTSSVHLGGILTIPKSTDQEMDISSLSSNVSDKSSSCQNIGNYVLFQNSAINGCIEIQKLIIQYNIKSPTINMENFCKSVQRQINNNKKIMQMESIMRELILGYLYLSSSWTSLASVLIVPKDRTGPLDHCFDTLTLEFLNWQKKSKIMLEEIIISLKKIPEEQNKYVSLVYKTSSSENSTVFSDDSDAESNTQEPYLNNYWYNEKSNNLIKYPNNNCNKRKEKKAKCVQQNNVSNKLNINSYDESTNYHRNSTWSNKNQNQKQTTNKFLKQDAFGQQRSNDCQNKPNQNTNSLIFNSGNGKKNYSSNRPPGRNKFNSVMSPKK